MPQPSLSPSPVFSCRQCGSCCQGVGGIKLRKHDILRLAAQYALSCDDFLARYAQLRNKKWELRSTATDNCVFLGPDGNCTVHTSRPDICRAWPFFRGNLVDPASLKLAKQACPGIRPDVTFAEFAAAGMEYLHSHELICPCTEKDGPNALTLYPHDCCCSSSEQASTVDKAGAPS